jgi:hypothetical protein
VPSDTPTRPRPWTRSSRSTALGDFRHAIESGSSTPQDVFRLFWAEAHTAREQRDLASAAKYFSNASEFAQEGEQQREVQFWWGYTFYQLGEGIAERENVGLDQLRQAQNYFQSAQKHFQRAGDVRQEAAQLRDGTDKWLLNLEARIKRATRSG